METVVAERVQQGSDRFRPLVYWYLTNRCNLACKHCWVNSSPHADTSADLATDEIMATIARLKEIDPGLVILTGGEPLLRKDALAIVEAILDQGIALSVETNGMLIQDEHVRLFRTALDRGASCGSASAWTVGLARPTKGCAAGVVSTRRSRLFTACAQRASRSGYSA